MSRRLLEGQSSENAENEEVKTCTGKAPCKPDESVDQSSRDSDPEVPETKKKCCGCFTKDMTMKEGISITRTISLTRRFQHKDPTTATMGDLFPLLTSRYCAAIFYDDQADPATNKQELSLEDVFFLNNDPQVTPFGQLYSGKFIHSTKENHSLLTIKVVEKTSNTLYATNSIRNEAICLRKLKDIPFFNNYVGAFQTNTACCLVTDNRNKITIKALVERVGILEENVIRFYAAEITCALGFLHSKGVIHRSLSSQTVALDDDGHIILYDLSFISFLKTTDLNVFDAPPYDFLAPEMVKGGIYNKSVDWWALGVIVYLCLYNRLPFSGSDDVDTVFKILQHPPVFVGTSESDNAINLCKALLVKKPFQRLGRGVKDVERVKEHAFFHDIDWIEIGCRQAIPPELPDLTSKQDIDRAASFHKMEISSVSRLSGSTPNLNRMPSRFQRVSDSSYGFGATSEDDNSVQFQPKLNACRLAEIEEYKKEFNIIQRRFDPVQLSSRQSMITGSGFSSESDGSELFRRRSMYLVDRRRSSLPNAEKPNRLTEKNNNNLVSEFPLVKDEAFLSPFRSLSEPCISNTTRDWDDVSDSDSCSDDEDAILDRNTADYTPQRDAPCGDECAESTDKNMNANEDYSSKESQHVASVFSKLKIDTCWSKVPTKTIKDDFQQKLLADPVTKNRVCDKNGKKQSRSIFTPRCLISKYKYSSLNDTSRDIRVDFSNKRRNAISLDVTTSVSKYLSSFTTYNHSDISERKDISDTENDVEGIDRISSSPNCFDSIGTQTENHAGPNDLEMLTKPIQNGTGDVNNNNDDNAENSIDSKDIPQDKPHMDLSTLKCTENESPVMPASEEIQTSNDQELGTESNKTPSLAKRLWSNAKQKLRLDNFWKRSSSSQAASDIDTSQADNQTNSVTDINTMYIPVEFLNMFISRTKPTESFYLKRRATYSESYYRQVCDRSAHPSTNTNTEAECQLKEVGTQTLPVTIIRSGEIISVDPSMSDTDGFASINFAVEDSVKLNVVTNSPNGIIDFEKHEDYSKFYQNPCALSTEASQIDIKLKKEANESTVSSHIGSKDDSHDLVEFWKDMYCFKDVVSGCRPASDYEADAQNKPITDTVQKCHLGENPDNIHITHRLTSEVNTGDVFDNELKPQNPETLDAIADCIINSGISTQIDIGTDITSTFIGNDCTGSGDSEDRTKNISYKDYKYINKEHDIENKHDVTESDLIRHFVNNNFTNNEKITNDLDGSKPLNDGIRDKTSSVVETTKAKQIELDCDPSSKDCIDNCNTDDDQTVNNVTVSVYAARESTETRFKVSDQETLREGYANTKHLCDAGVAHISTSSTNDSKERAQNIQANRENEEQCYTHNKGNKDYTLHGNLSEDQVHDKCGMSDKDLDNQHKCRRFTSEINGKSVNKDFQGSGKPEIDNENIDKLDRHNKTSNDPTDTDNDRVWSRNLHLRQTMALENRNRLMLEADVISPCHTEVQQQSHSSNPYAPKAHFVGAGDQVPYNLSAPALAVRSLHMEESAQLNLQGSPIIGSLTVESSNPPVDGVVVITPE